MLRFFLGAANLFSYKGLSESSAHSLGQEKLGNLQVLRNQNPSYPVLTLVPHLARP